MNYLFEAVNFNNKPMIFDPNVCSTSAFTGYYHWHQCCEILIVHEGQGNIIVNQKKYEMRPGRLFFFQPYQLHRVTADVSEHSPYSRTLLFFEPHYLDKVLESMPLHQAKFQALWRNQHTQTVIDLLPEMIYLQHIFDIYKTRTLPSMTLDRDEDITMLMLHIIEAISFAAKTLEQNENSPREYRPFSYSEQAMNWVEEHYTEEIHLEDIAKSLHLSKYYLSRIFQKETGGSLSEYIIARRIKQACRLLYSTSFSIEHIAINIGYPNVSYFIRLFKKVMGTTPLRYRSNARNASTRL